MNRPLYLFGIALALASTAAAQCRAKFQTGENKKFVAAPWASNAGELQWSADNPNCKVDKSADATWVAVSVMPPTTASAGILRYSIDTNFTPSPRKALVQLGDAAIEFTQAPGPKPGMALSPGRIELQFSPSENAPKEITKTLFVASDEPQAYAARMIEQVDWVTVKANSPGANRQQTFIVTVKTDRLKPGTHKANIQVDAPDASNAREIVPVVVQVGPPAAEAPPSPAK